jgi:DNA modification methylase
MTERNALSETAPHRLPTNTTTKHHPVHRWLNFVAGFSPEFVTAAIDSRGVRAGGVLLDPFAGMGTALVAANMHGMDSIGYEAHPFFADIALAKITTRNLAQIDAVSSVLATVEPVSNLYDVWGPDARTFLLKLVDEKSLAYLAGARVAEESCPPDARNLYRLVVTRILEGATGSKTDGIYKAPATLKRSIDILETKTKVLNLIRDDINLLSGDTGQAEIPPRRIGESRLYPKTAETMSDIASNSIDICVTSPPYLNNFDFAEMTRMELYFWNYAANWREITERVRSKLIINTTTAPTTERRRQEYWASGIPGEILSNLTDLRSSLTEQRLLRPGKKEYDSLVLPYFSQMYSVINEVRRVLKAGAPLHLVVSDAALYGVHIHTEQILADLMLASGLDVKEIIRLRDRGGRWVLSKRQGAADGLGEFHIYAVKAS